MNRTHLIAGLIVALSLLAPSMFCLIPGATMTAAEMECCHQMGSACGDFQMPAHACCKVSAPSGERSLIAQATLQVPPSETAIIDNLAGIRPETQRPRSDKSWDRNSPLLLPLHSADILRI